MALLRDKGVLGSVVTEAEALEAFRRHATQAGSHDKSWQLGVAGCKRAVKELLESKDMLSRYTYTHRMGNGRNSEGDPALSCARAAAAAAEQHPLGVPNAPPFSSPPSAHKLPPSHS